MNDSAKTKKRFNPWPLGLVLWFVFFIGICVWFVIRSMDMRYDLVSKDYYVKGLHHDEHRMALSRTKALENPPRIEVEYDKHRMVVYIPEMAHDAILTLYRPSDSRMDRRYDLQDGAPSVIPTLGVPPGRWEARISWQTNQTAYLHEQLLDIH